MNKAKLDKAFVFNWGKCSSVLTHFRPAQQGSPLEQSPSVGTQELGALLGALEGIFDKDGAWEGIKLGIFDGSNDGAWEGKKLGIFDKDGAWEGKKLGIFDGSKEGAWEGKKLGIFDGSIEGSFDGFKEGFLEGDAEDLDFLTFFVFLFCFTFFVFLFCFPFMSPLLRPFFASSLAEPSLAGEHAVTARTMSIMTIALFRANIFVVCLWLSNRAAVRTKSVCELQREAMTDHGCLLFDEEQHQDEEYKQYWYVLQ